MRLLLIFLFSTISLFSQEVKFLLSSQSLEIEAASPFELSATFEIDKDGYIYAPSGSQAGLPTEIKLTLPAGFSAGNFEFPAPLKKSENGTEILYYTGKVTAVAKVTPPADLSAKSVQISAQANWLYCGTMCIPQDAQAQITLKVAPLKEGAKDAKINTSANALQKLEAANIPTNNKASDLPKVAPLNSATADSEISTSAVLFAMLGAFFGGMILNLMPCVFPVIGLKILSFAKDADKSRTQAAKNALYYSLGVVLSFVFMGLVLIWLKALGGELGWGFQLQEPIFVAFLAILFCAMALSFAGVFEIGAQLAKFGAVSGNSSGAKSSLLSGVLAVLVASPCTAPFMGSALGIALASSISIVSTLFIFISLGVGMAFPYVLISLLPQVSRLLPKPGMWMETFKQILSFPLFATAIWLVWIFAKQLGVDAAAQLLFAALFVAFGLWIFGKYSPPYNKLKLRIFAYCALILCISLAASFVIDASKNPEVNSEQKSSANVWSAQRVHELQKEGKIVFVDFTASWCLTCVANKKAVLDLPSTREFFAKNNVAFLTGDWTNKDPLITKELAKFGRSGVPLYIVYSANPEKSPIVLPAILTQSAVYEAIDKAKQ